MKLAILATAALFLFSLAHGVLADLPEEQREVFLLRAHGDLELQQIAELTRTPAETVKSRLRYALNKLRRLLADPASAEEVSA